MSSTLAQHCINVIQMFCVCWEVFLITENNAQMHPSKPHNCYAKFTTNMYSSTIKYIINEEKCEHVF